MISYWGIDHGDEVSKAQQQPQKASSGRLAAGVAGNYFTPGIHGAVAGRKGKKLRSFGNEALGTIGGGFAGGFIGGATAKLHGGRLMKPLGIGGTAGGAIAGTSRNQKKGYLKPEKKF